MSAPCFPPRAPPSPSPCLPQAVSGPACPELPAVPGPSLAGGGAVLPTVHPPQNLLLEG